MNRKDLRAGFEVRKIDKKDLVESAFAQTLGRKGFEVIRCGDEKDWGVVFLHPRQERAEHSLGEAAIDALAGSAGEAFFDFVDPDDDGRHHLGLLERLAEAAFGFADETIEEHAGIHAKEWALPGGGDGFGGEAFASALNAEHEDAARSGDSESGRVVGEG